jgi:hypothetical protein
MRCTGDSHSTLSVALHYSNSKLCFCHLITFSVLWLTPGDEFAIAIDDFQFRDVADFGAVTRLIYQFEWSVR